MSRGPHASRAAALVLALATAGATVSVSAGTTLLDAAKQRNLERALAALESGADVNGADVDGATPLLYAAHTAQQPLLAALLDAGADPTRTNRYGVAPIHEAARVGDADMLRHLLDAGEEVDHALPEGETPLMLAARTSRLDAVELLIARGADVNAAERWQGQTALMYTALHDRPHVARALLDAGAIADARTPRPQLPARIAAARFNVEFPQGGMTALLFTARDGALATAQVLIAAGADVDAATPEGFSPLVIALHNLHFDVAKALIEAGADPNGGALYAVINARNRVPLDGPQPKPTGRTQPLELLTALLERGARLDDRPPLPLPDTDIGFGAVPVTVVDRAIIRAARSADLDSLDLLIRHGADPTVAEPSGLNTLLAVVAGPELPPLTVVAEERPSQPDAIAAIDFLLARGVEVDAADLQGVTALHTAARRGYSDVARHLIARGARRDAVDADGRTALDYAEGRMRVLFGTPPVHEPTARVLRELGVPAGTTPPPPRRQ